MLTEQQLKALPEALWRDFQRLEADIVTRIAGHVKRIGELTATDVHRLSELNRIGYDLQEIEREIAAITDRSQKEIEAVFRRAAKMEYDGQRIGFELTGTPYVPFEDNEQLQTLVESISRAATDELRNMSGTSGFFNPRNARGVLLRQSTWQPLHEYYASVIDYATLQVRTGQVDFYGAMRATIRDMADRGFTTVDYASDYRRRLDTAVRSNMMDSLARLSMEQATIVGAQFGADGMEVSWHVGPRPSHRWVGGIQVSLEKYERCVKPTLMEPNCYHRAYPIILGVSPPTYTRSELDALNAKDMQPREYNGRMYDAYAAQQKQRDYETRIRAQKVRVVGFGAEGDKESAQSARARAKAIQAQYARFSHAMGLPVNKQRTRVSGYR